MNDYEMKAYEDVQAWRLKVMKRSGIFNKLSKKAQNKMNSYIPKKVHQIITDSMKNMVKAILVGSEWTTKKKLAITGGLYEQRSEEHTSELQSRGHLVCRLLLEKKK